MSKLPLVSSKDLEKLITGIGFVFKRQKGSHAFYRHEDGRYTTIPHHKGRTISRPLLRQILKQVDITIQEYVELLKEI